MTEEEIAALFAQATSGLQGNYDQYQALVDAVNNQSTLQGSLAGEDFGYIPDGRVQGVSIGGAYLPEKQQLSRSAADAMLSGFADQGLPIYKDINGQRAYLNTGFQQVYDDYVVNPTQNDAIGQYSTFGQYTGDKPGPLDLLAFAGGLVGGPLVGSALSSLTGSNFSGNGEEGGIDWGGLWSAGTFVTDLATSNDWESPDAPKDEAGSYIIEENPDITGIPDFGEGIDFGWNLGDFNKDIFKDTVNPDIFSTGDINQTDPTTMPEPQTPASQPTPTPSRPDETGGPTPTFPSTSDVFGDQPSDNTPPLDESGDTNEPDKPWWENIMSGTWDEQWPNPNDPNTQQNGGSFLDWITGMFNQQQAGNQTQGQSIGNVVSGGGSVGDTTASGGTGGSNVLGDIGSSIGDILGGGVTAGGASIGDTIINSGISAYAADKQLDGINAGISQQKSQYDADVLRMEKYNQLGIDNISAAELAAQSKPVEKDMFAGQATISPSTTAAFDLSKLNEIVAGSKEMGAVDPNLTWDKPEKTDTSMLQAMAAGDRGVNLGDATGVAVNQRNPYDSNDAGLQYLLKQGGKAIEGSAAARGGLYSGDTMQALQEMGQGAALNREQQLQGIESQRDSMSLAAQGQKFGQQNTNANVNNALNQQDLSNSSAIRNQQFNEANNQFNQGAQLAGLDIGTQGQEFSQGMSANDFTNLLNQQGFSNSAAARSQMYGEAKDNTYLDFTQKQANITNGMDVNDQLFSQLLSNNEYDQKVDQQEFSQLYELIRGGQAAAAGQASVGGGYADSLSGLYGNAANVKAGRGIGYGNALSKLFGMG